jgi:hypothetical protein
MPLQVFIIGLLVESKQLVHECSEAYDIGAFERFEVVDTAIIQFSQIRMLYELSRPQSEDL